MIKIPSFFSSPYPSHPLHDQNNILAKVMRLHLLTYPFILARRNQICCVVIVQREIEVIIIIITLSLCS